MPGLRLTDEAAAQNVAAKEELVEVERGPAMLPMTVLGGAGEDTVVATDNDVQVFQVDITEDSGTGESVVSEAPAPDNVGENEAENAYGDIKLDDRDITLLAKGDIYNEADLRAAIAAGRDLTEINGIGGATNQDILDAVRDADLADG